MRARVKGLTFQFHNIDRSSKRSIDRASGNLKVWQFYIKHIPLFEDERKIDLTVTLLVGIVN